MTQARGLYYACIILNPGLVLHCRFIAASKKNRYPPLSLLALPGVRIVSLLTPVVPRTARLEVLAIGSNPDHLYIWILGVNHVNTSKPADQSPENLHGTLPVRCDSGSCKSYLLFTSTTTYHNSCIWQASAVYRSMIRIINANPHV